MYRRVLNLDKNSFIEMASRITTDGELLMLALRGAKNDKQASVASVLLNKIEIEQLIKDLKEWSLIDVKST